MSKIVGGDSLKRVLSVGLLSLLAISVFVSLDFFQSAGAERGKGWEWFYFNVWMPTGEAESNVKWLSGWNLYPIHWWGEPSRWVFPPEEYWEDGVFVCHGDWRAGCTIEEGDFRYRWWIYWDDPAGECLGGKFSFSHGSGDFQGMLAFGDAWVTGYPEGYQCHEGLIHKAP